MKRSKSIYISIGSAAKGHIRAGFPGKWRGQFMPGAQRNLPVSCRVGDTCVVDDFAESGFD